ncbi:MAG: glycosyltransferase family 4 protein [Chloroflexi bacterium]|nr:glycosyltransferase family 4 protein [Chloroflexota bacterium]
MSGHIFINGRFLSQPLTGVQRYSHELLRALDELDPNVELTCLAPPEDFPRPNWKNIELKVIGKNRGNVWEQFDLPLWLKGRFLFSPSNIGPAFYRNQAVTFHDASVFAVPQAYSRMFKAKYRFVFHQLVKSARCILTDSVFSQRELAKYLDYDLSRFNVVPLGGDHLQNIQTDDHILESYGLRGQSYILMVASQSPHKNTPRLLEAIVRLRGETRFALAGGSFKNVFQNSETSQLPSNVIQLGYINDAELKSLYEHALGFIFPSYYEGFGLPILEAMNCNCPVLSSLSASLPEVGGDAVVYFDPFNVDDIKNKIENFISDLSLQDELRQRGKIHAKQFAWSKTAQRTLDLLSPYF